MGMTTQEVGRLHGKPEGALSPSLLVSIHMLSIIALEIDYFPDLVANRTVDFILESHVKYPTMPILAFNAWPTPHGPHTPAPQYKGHFAGRQAPRTPNWNASEEAQSTKHWIVRHQDIITESVGR